MVDAIDLHRWLVRNGWALNSEPYAHGRFKAVIAHTRARHARDRTAVEQMILRQLEE